ncbi:MAG: hypothetical protein J2P15_04110, partial [Micromonosporaceae bacterium]|nr:hypothetical protein [Micromonosporaceae bacterium]
EVVAAQAVAASRRVALARQVHNDLVRDALAVRRRRLVRVLRLARKHPEPSYFDVDDPILDADGPAEDAPGEDAPGEDADHPDDREATEV